MVRLLQAGLVVLVGLAASSNTMVVTAFSTSTLATATRTISTSTSTTRLHGQRMKNRSPGRIVPQTEFLTLEADGSDAWKTMDLVDILNRGGVGVLPTDTGYGFVTPLESRTGLERLFRIRDLNHIESPLSVLCSDLATIDKYCLVSQKKTFKTLKKYLPGPYTFLLPSKTTNRGMLFDERGYKHSWKKQVLGVRMPDDPVLRYLQDELLLGEIPLVFSSLASSDDEEDDYEQDDVGRLLECFVDPNTSWCSQVDFVVNAGSRPFDGSTVYDMTLREPELIREGLGEQELVA